MHIQPNSWHTDEKQSKYNPATALPTTHNSRLQNLTDLPNWKVQQHQNHWMMILERYERQS
jgi:hypothetical protein